MIRPADLAPDAHVIGLGGIGAPTVSVEKMEEGGEGIRVLRAIEAAYRAARRCRDLRDEIGGRNGIDPMITAAQLDLPVVDADGMGRAFPEVQMTTFFIYGQANQPAALSDSEGNTLVITQARSARDAGKTDADGTVAMGCTAYMTTAPMTGDFRPPLSVLPTPPARPGSWAMPCCGRAPPRPIRSPRSEARSGGQSADAGKVTDIAPPDRKAVSCAAA